jgi:hypothetical protein
MPVLTQLNLNVGTEQNPNMVLHDLHDIRISSTDVTTVTRLLGCDEGVNSIAPLTLASAASLLGGELNFKKKQFPRAGGSGIYARIDFGNSGSTSSSADILCTVQPINSNIVYTSIIYAYKYNQTNISGTSIKKITSLGGNTTAVYFKEQYVYVKCPGWCIMSLEVLNSDTTSVVFDIVDSLPSGCSEASEIQ